jgi:hypothetical protein
MIARVVSDVIELVCLAVFVAAVAIVSLTI